jgi:hypothetical protein
VSAPAESSAWRAVLPALPALLALPGQPARLAITAKPHGQPCPLTSCPGRAIARPVCGEHWRLVERCCKGKTRHAREQTAEEHRVHSGVQALGRAVYRCALCHAWHIGARDMGTVPLAEIRAACWAVRGAYDRAALAELVRSWDPASTRDDSPIRPQAVRGHRNVAGRRPYNPVAERIDPAILARLQQFTLSPADPLPSRATSSPSPTPAASPLRSDAKEH